VDSEPNIRNKLVPHRFTAVLDPMSGGSRLFIAATVGCLALVAILVGADFIADRVDHPNKYPGYTETLAEAQRRLPWLSLEKGKTAAKQLHPCQDYAGHDQSDLCAQWRAADAAERSSRWSFWQVVLGFLGVMGLLATLWFNFQAWNQARKGEQDTKEALRAAQHNAAAATRLADAAHETLQLTRQANAAIVRPHIAIESATIAFANDQLPRVQLTTRNASDFTAHDWEWQPLLKYRVAGSPNERKTPLRPWGPRGVAGVDLSPGDQGPRIPATIAFPFNDAEAVAATALQPNEALQVTLTVFTRCYDALGNSVDDRHPFATVVCNLVGVQPGHEYPFQRVPAGTQIEGEEDQVPEAPLAGPN